MDVKLTVFFPTEALSPETKILWGKKFDGIVTLHLEEMEGSEAMAIINPQGPYDLLLQYEFDGKFVIPLTPTTVLQQIVLIESNMHHVSTIPFRKSKNAKKSTLDLALLHYCTSSQPPIKTISFPCGSRILPFFESFAPYSAFCSLCSYRLQQINRISSEITSSDTLEKQFKARLRSHSFICQIVIDALLGCFCMALIWKFKAFIMAFLEKRADVLEEHVLVPWILWLRGAPLGLKLNPAFAFRLGDTFWYFLNIWNDFKSNFKFLEAPVFALVAMTCPFGLSLSLALIIDAVSIISIHIRILQVMTSKMFLFFRACTKSLLLLFNGQKRNILRNRVDSGNFDLQEYFLGVLFLTMFIFLIPSVVVFHPLFATYQMFIQGVQLLLWFVIYFLNHCPLYLILIKICNGIEFDFMKALQHGSLLRLCVQHCSPTLCFTIFFHAFSFHLKHFQSALLKKILPSDFIEAFLFTIPPPFMREI